MYYKQPLTQREPLIALGLTLTEHVGLMLVVSVLHLALQFVAGLAHVLLHLLPLLLLHFIQRLPTFGIFKLKRAGAREAGGMLARSAKHPGYRRGLDAYGSCCVKRRLKAFYALIQAQAQLKTPTLDSLGSSGQISPEDHHHNQTAPEAQQRQDEVTWGRRNG